MLIKNYSDREKIVNSLNKFLQKMVDKNEMGYFTINKSGGMGSFETLYIDIYNISEDDYFTIRYSNHTNGVENYNLWDGDFSSIKDLKKTIKNIVSVHEFEEVYEWEPRIGLS